MGGAQRNGLMLMKNGCKAHQESAGSYGF